MHCIVLMQIATQAQRDGKQVLNGVQNKGKYMPARTVLCPLELGQTVVAWFSCGVALVFTWDIYRMLTPPTRRPSMSCVSVYPSWRTDEVQVFLNREFFFFFCFHMLTIRTNTMQSHKQRPRSTLFHPTLPPISQKKRANTNTKPLQRPIAVLNIKVVLGNCMLFRRRRTSFHSSVRFIRVISLTCFLQSLFHRVLSTHLDGWILLSREGHFFFSCGSISRSPSGQVSVFIVWYPRSFFFTGHSPWEALNKLK